MIESTLDSSQPPLLWKSPKKTLIFSFVAIIGSFIAVSLLFVSTTQELSLRLVQNSEKELDSIKTLQTVKGDLTQMRMDLAQFPVVNDARRKQILLDRDQLIHKVQKKLSNVEQSLVTPIEMEMYQNFNSSFEQYLALAPNFFELAKIGKLQEAAIYRANFTNPTAMKAAEGLDQLMMHQLSEMRADHEASILKAQKDQELVKIIEIVAILLSIAVFSFVFMSFQRYEKRIFTDANALHKVNEEVVQANNRSIQAAKLASLGEMAAGIAHEINNPLQIIEGSTGLLLEETSLSEQHRAKIERISRASARISKIVRGLKKYSRDEVTKTRVQEKLEIILNDALAIADPNLKRNQVQVQLDIEPGLRLYCDTVEIEQVVMNLMSNAIDAVKTHAERWLKIRAFSTPMGVVLQFVDSGPGVSPQVEQKIFQPFFTTKPVGEGTGLGLSIAKGILQNHGATITLNRNSPNTCFEICFTQTESINEAA